MPVAVKSRTTISIVALSVRPPLTLCGVYSCLGGTKPLEEGVLLRYQARDYITLVFPFHYSKRAVLVHFWVYCYPFVTRDWYLYTYDTRWYCLGHLGFRVSRLIGDNCVIVAPVEHLSLHSHSTFLSGERGWLWVGHA